MNIFAGIQMGLVVTQAVMNLVHQVEGPGNGEQKKEAVKGLARVAVAAAFQLTYGQPISEDLKAQIEVILGEVIDAIVKIYNDTGTFVHSLPPKTVTVQPAPPAA